MVVFQRRRSDASSVYTGYSGDSVISAITMEDDCTTSSGHSRRSLHRFDPKLRSLAEKKRASDPAEEEVKQCLDELRVPGRNNNRFSCCSEGEKQMCAIPRRRLSTEFTIAATQPMNNTSYVMNEQVPEDDECDDDVSMASIETLVGSYFAYDFIEMGLDEIEYELPIKECEDCPRSHSARPRRNYVRRRYRSTCSSSITSDERSHCHSRISESARTRHTR